MIYGSANYFKVPWETIIKVYRRNYLGPRTYGTVREYLDDFVKYISSETFVTSDNEALFVGVATLHTAFSLRMSASRKNAKWTSKEIVREIDALTERADHSLLPSFSSESYGKFKKAHQGAIDDILSHDQYFDFKIPRTCWPRFYKCVFAHLRSSLTTNSASGIVVVGFGENQLFPDLVESKIDGSFRGKVRLSLGRDININGDSESVAIEAFAQEDVVDAFMRGIDEQYKQHATKLMRGFLRSQVEDLINNHTRYDDDTKKVILRAQRSSLAEALVKFNKQLDEFSRLVYTGPVKEVLRLATRDEMAEIAEALVNLTAIKRRMSPERETVGGLVDVAIISKGDGFIWLKRKTLFQARAQSAFL